ncbi:MAG: hypothetical protein ACYSUK_03765 [Planctomycetota bacterium]|jgi:hypothetical protein
MAREEKQQMFYPNFGAVIVTQPGDEALWAGGTILMHPETKWTILSLCGGSDPELQSRFNKAMESFGAQGIIGHFQVDADETFTQFQAQKAIGKLMFSERFDAIITHTFWGEFEHTKMASITAKSVLGMTRTGQLMAKQILQFACEKKEESPLVTPVQEADVLIELDEEIMEKKFRIVTDVYGYSQDTIEVKSLSDKETFWLLGQKIYPERKREQKKEGTS